MKRLLRVGAACVLALATISASAMPLGARLAVHGRSAVRQTAAESASQVWTVTFDPNYADATERVPPMAVTNGCAVGELPTPTRSGYTFDGWFTAADVGSRVLKDFAVTTNMTLYAHWTEVAGGGETGGGGETENGGGETGTSGGETGGGIVPNPVPETPVAEVPVLMADTPSDATERVPPMACVYDGYLYDKDRALMGTIQVKVGKPNAKTGLAAVSAVVVGLDGKKTKLKASDNGKAQIASDGPTTVSLEGGESCTVVLGADGMGGTYGAYEIDGARNVFTSKDSADKAAAAAVLAKWKGAVNVAWRADATERVPPYNTLSVSIANKGKVKVAGTLANGTKVSASGQLSVGEEWCCVPVVVSKKGVSLQFAVWLPAATSAAAPVVVGLGDDVKVGKPGTLKGGAAFRIDADAFAARWGQRALPYLPDGVAVGGGAKWTLPKAGSVAYAKGTTTVDEAKAGENPSGLKLTYKAKDGTFKGSFKAYSDVNGKPKATKVNVTGVLVDGVGYGAATIKKVGGVAVTVE